MQSKKRFLIETRNMYGKTLMASSVVGEDDALSDLYEHLSAAGITDLLDNFEYGSSSDAVSAIGPVGSTPELWKTPNGTTIVLQQVL